jgi:polyisoprenoid-binding protein YceI
MKKKILIAAVVGVVALGGYFAYQNYVNKQQLAKADASNLVTNKVVQTPTTVPTGPMRNFKLTSKDSPVKWTGYKKVGRHSGWFIIFEGTGAMSGHDLTTAKIDLTIDTESTETDDPTGVLTAVMKKADFFNCEKFPQSTFKSVSIAKTDKPDIYTVTGDLQLRDVTKTIAFPATITEKDGVVKLTADFKVNRKWWGIVWKGAGDSVLEDDARIELNAEATEVK